jgi:hypothetical protein
MQHLARRTLGLGGPHGRAILHRHAKLQSRDWATTPQRRCHTRGGSHAAHAAWHASFCGANGGGEGGGEARPCPPPRGEEASLQEPQGWFVTPPGTGECITSLGLRGCPSSHNLDAGSCTDGMPGG